MRKLILTEEQIEELKKRKKHKRKKDCSAMAQVGGKVNAGIMDGITAGGMMEEDVNYYERPLSSTPSPFKSGIKVVSQCPPGSTGDRWASYVNGNENGYKEHLLDDENVEEGAEPEANTYSIGPSASDTNISPYYHVDESTDSVTFGGGRLTCYDSDAVPFISFIKKDGSKTKIFVGQRGELHSTMPVALLSNGDIKKEDFGSLWDVKRDEERSGRVWILDDCAVISFYSYSKNIKKIYDACVEALTVVMEKTGDSFSIGKTMVDWWTFDSRNTVIVPVRWLNNGVLDAYAPYIKSCTPFESFTGEYEYELKTTKGTFRMDWKGEETDSISASYSINESVGEDFNLEESMKSLMEFMSKKIDIKPYPEIHLNDDDQDGLFIRTGYYLPDKKSVTLFTTDRHPKDILRSLAHELIHHNQNLRDPNIDWGSGGNLEDDDVLRKLEAEAFLKGNLLFREWTENEKPKQKQSLNENNSHGFINESPDFVETMNKKYTDSDAHPFMYCYDDGEFYVGENGETHYDIYVNRDGVSAVQKGREFDTLHFEDICELTMTGRYFEDVNVISFWNTPIRNLSTIRETIDRLKKDGIISSSEYLLLDYWDNKENATMIFPIKWLYNGTYKMFGDDCTNITPMDAMEYENTGKYTYFQVRTRTNGVLVVNLSGNEIYTAMEFYLKHYETSTVNENIESELAPDDVDLSSFRIKKELNPKFWKDGHLDSRIRLKLIDIADAVMDYIDADWFDPEDVTMTGSLANYNWNDKYSDIDLHILLDFDDIDEDKEMAKKYVDNAMKSWKSEHKDITIFGFPVEVYVQDANEPHASSGVYSIDKDKWLVEPDYEKLKAGKVNKEKIRKMVSFYATKIDELCDIYNETNDDEYRVRKLGEKVEKVFKAMKDERKKGLSSSSSEINNGNIMYKALRRGGYLQKIIDLRHKVFDKSHSLLKEENDGLRVYMMIGIPGAGKSTWIQNNHPELPVVSRDIIRAELGMCEPGQKYAGTNDEENEVTMHEYIKMGQYCSEGQDFIIDDTNTHKKYRKQMIDFLRKKGAKIVFVHLNTPLEVCKERRKNDIPGNVMDRIHSRFQAPEEDEYDEIIHV